jgi:hypothetical protein
VLFDRKFSVSSLGRTSKVRPLDQTGSLASLEANQSAAYNLPDPLSKAGNVEALAAQR